MVSAEVRHTQEGGRAAVDHPPPVAGEAGFLPSGTACSFLNVLATRSRRVHPMVDFFVGVEGGTRLRRIERKNAHVYVQYNQVFVASTRLG